MITTNELPAATGKGRLIALWIPSGLVALAFMGAGGHQSDRCRRSGRTKRPGRRWLAEFPLRLNAAVLLAAVMVGAFIAHATVLDSSSAAPVALFVRTGIIAYSRKH